jgi:hypothetical protein
MIGARCPRRRLMNRAKMAVAFGERVGSSPTACRSRAGQRPFGVGIGLVIESSLKTMPTRDALATVSELVAQERDRKAAVTAARPEIQPRFAQQRRAVPARDQLEICDRTARDLEDPASGTRFNFLAGAMTASPRVVPRQLCPPLVITRYCRRMVTYVIGCRVITGWQIGAPELDAARED